MPHITFIHGIANKPPQDKLLRIWRTALARDNGLDLGARGVSSSMIYWADVMYESPADEEVAFESVAAGESPDIAAAAREPGVDPAWKMDLSGVEQAWLLQLETKMKIEAAVDEIGTTIESVLSPEQIPDVNEGDVDPNHERIWLPAAAKKKLMEHFLRDVHHYLFNAAHSPRLGTNFQVQDEIRRRFIAALKEDLAKLKKGPHIIVSHSMGTVISYDCLTRAADCLQVDALLTLGSPLGIDEIQDGFAPEYSAHDGFPNSNLRGSWINVFDRLDPVAGLDPWLRNDYQHKGEGLIEDIHEPNWGQWRHDVTKYLQGKQLRAKLKQLLQI